MYCKYSERKGVKAGGRFDVILNCRNERKLCGTREREEADQSGLYSNARIVRRCVFRMGDGRWELVLVVVVMLVWVRTGSEPGRGGREQEDGVRVRRQDEWRMGF